MTKEKKEGGKDGQKTGDTDPKEPMSKPYKKEKAFDLLVEVAAMLREYEAHHLAKIPPLQEIVDANADQKSVQAAQFSIEGTKVKAERNATMAQRIEGFVEENPKLHINHVVFLRQLCITTFERDTGVKFTDAPEEHREGVEQVIATVTEAMTPFMRYHDPVTDTQPMETLNTIVMAGHLVMQLVTQIHQQAIPQMDAHIEEVMRGSEGQKPN